VANPTFTTSPSPFGTKSWKVAWFTTFIAIKCKKNGFSLLSSHSPPYISNNTKENIINLYNKKEDNIT
jgi:hypothetical protein